MWFAIKSDDVILAGILKVLPVELWAEPWNEKATANATAHSLITFIYCEYNECKILKNR
jgi:hypothetical protein